MKKNTKRIFWGLVFLLLAVGLTLRVFFPGVAWSSGVSAWKWFVGAVLLYWIVSNLVFGRNLRAHFDVFLPLALLFAVFKTDLARLTGMDLEPISSWAVIGIALLLTIALNLLLGGVGTGRKRPAEVDNRYSDSVVYLDLAGKNRFSVFNRMGSTEVYFQNTEAGDPTQPISLYVDNSFGEMTVHVPADWRVVSHVGNSLGSVSVRDNPTVFRRELVVEGSNRLGDVSFDA